MEPQDTQAPTAPTPEPQMPQGKKSMGPLVGTFIVLVVLILGGLFLWKSKLDQDTANLTQFPYILGDDNADAGLPPTSSSDTVTDIESDISATDLDTFEAEIDADMKAVESAL